MTVEVLGNRVRGTHPTLANRRKTQTILERKTLHLTSLKPFFVLRGTLSENSEFDAAINFLI